MSGEDDSVTKRKVRWHGTVDVQQLASPSRLDGGPGTVVMLYAPRDDRERDVILRLVDSFCEFALAPGGQPAAGTDERPSAKTSIRAY